MTRLRFPALVSVTIALALCACGSALARPAPRHVRYKPTLASLNTHPLPGWWQAGKFGIIIHWGVYSLPGIGTYIPVKLPAEWYWYYQQEPGSDIWERHLQMYGPNFTYDDFIPQWHAQHFDPNAWIRLFEAAGAKYFVLTAKHHDGFALWCTKTTHRNSCDMGPHQDIVGELFAAAHRAHDVVKPGLYYSIPEWFTPAPNPFQSATPFPVSTWAGGLNVIANAVAGGPTVQSAFYSGPPHNSYTGLPVPYTGYQPISDYATGQVIPQLHELINRYHPYELWCDIGGPESYFHSNRTIADFYNQAAVHNPGGVLVNNRCGDSTTHHDYKVIETTTTYTLDANTTGPCENARTMGISWGYDQRDTDATDASPGQLIDDLITDVANNCNLLLDIGPRADGTIPEIQTRRLLAIGRWLKINGHAIYGSRTWTPTHAGNVWFTRGADRALYATTLSWPGQQLTINASIPTPKGTRIQLLGSNRHPLRYQQNGSSLTVTMPAATAAASTASQYAYTLRIGRARKSRHRRHHR